MLTRCGRDKVISILKTAFSNSFLAYGEIWIRYIKIYILEMPVMFRLQCFEGETKCCPFQDDIYIYIYIYVPIKFPVSFIFFKFEFSAFLNFHTEIYCVILSSCTESGSNAVHRMTSLLGNVFPTSGPMCGPWVIVGSLHKGPTIQRYICPRLIHFALFFLLTSVKR